MQYFGHFYLDKEKDIIVELYYKNDKLAYTLRTPNHKTGNLITNLAKLCDLPVSFDDAGLKIIDGIVPCYIDANNQKIFIFRLGNTKVANIFPDGKIEMKASIPSISKTLMSQTKNYHLDISKTIIKTFVLDDYKFKTDLHTHMNANLHPDTLIALGIMNQIRYPLYYIKKLNLRVTKKQARKLTTQRQHVKTQFQDSSLTGKYLERRIDDYTYINFADLILNNIDNAAYNIAKIRASLSILKDGQAVFTNLEKVYLYRYVFTKGTSSEKKISLNKIDRIPDIDISNTLQQMLMDKENPHYKDNSLFQDKLLWIARTYQAQGIEYVEISDTTLVKKYESVKMLKEVHEIMPHITKETGVVIRFLAALRRIPLTIVKDQITADDYLKENLDVLRAISIDPYVAGSDIVGEEINDISELQPVIQELVSISRSVPSFVIRIHAGENDSLRDNVANSIQIIKDSLAKNQKMPKVRLGHGLYTANLKSKKGKQLLKDLKENNVVLEFQITSNVRLNNLNNLETHPLKQYLKEDILCVQGTDGGALYGTNTIDEQLSLEKLLNLSPSDLQKLKQTETIIHERSLKFFKQKFKKFTTLQKDMDLDDFLLSRMTKNTRSKKYVIKKGTQYDANIELIQQIEELPWNKYPIIIAGGSFNNNAHHTKTKKEYLKLIDELMKALSPKEVFFVIGHSLNAYEKYLVENNTKGFKIFAIVPLTITKNELNKLKKSHVSIRVSVEANPMGLYKSFNYEIFERRPFTLIAFDGNSAGANLIQEAKNSKGKGYIFVNSCAATLRIKADSLGGYVTLFNASDTIIPNIIKTLPKAE